MEAVSREGESLRVLRGETEILTTEDTEEHGGEKDIRRQTYRDEPWLRVRAGGEGFRRPVALGQIARRVECGGR